MCLRLYVAIYTIQKLSEYHEYAVNTFSVIAFRTQIRHVHHTLQTGAKVRRGDQNMPRFGTPTFYEIVS